MALVKFKGTVYGSGTQDDPITVNDFDDFMFLLHNGNTALSAGYRFYYEIVDNEYKYYDNTIAYPNGRVPIKIYIALDPNAENKIIDCNNFSIGEHGLSNLGLRIFEDIFSDNNGDNSYGIAGIYGNDWIFKNFWVYSDNDNPTKRMGFFSFRHANRNNSLFINKLHFLNCFHNGGSLEEAYLFTTCNGNNEKNNSGIYVTFNDCKFSILTTGGTVYKFFPYTTNSSFPQHFSFNRCSFNILSTSNDFKLNAGYSGSSVTYVKNIFYNCNFRFNIKNTSNFLYGGVAANAPIYNFCKFSGVIHNATSIGGNLRTGHDEVVQQIKNNFINCLWQVNVENFVNQDYSFYFSLSDQTAGLVNSQHSTKYKNDFSQNMVSLTKAQLLDQNILISNNFPVMTKIIPDKNEV